MTPSTPHRQKQPPPFLQRTLLAVASASLLLQATLASSPFVESWEGQLPIVLSAPHGGREKPDTFPDRPSGTFAFDLNTQELAKAAATALHQLTGQPADLVVCQLHRLKVDCNREPSEGTAHHPATLAVWTDYHTALTNALQRAVQRHGFALLIDLHGHGHSIPRMEIGYGHSPETYAQGEPALNSARTRTQSTLAPLLARPSPFSYAELLRGPRSLGSLLSQRGFPATPSQTVPVPPIPYFNGGYTVRRYPAEIPGVAALQIETHYRGLRDLPENQKRFGEALAATLQEYLAHWLGFTLPQAP